MRVHFIGIGGIGVSALAQYYLAKGHKVSGSDLVSSEITDFLKRKRIKIHIGKAVDPRLQQADLVIYSPAVRSGSPELKAAKKKKIKCLSYPQALGELAKKHFTIAVSGTHGKSTTTSMLSLLLVKAKLDPTVIVGTKIKEFGNSNYKEGKSDYLVIEADEHFASFLNYWPKIIVLTSIEADHLDFYKNLRNVLKTFKKYIGHLGKDGVLVANKDDGNIKQVINNKKQKTFFYSLNQPEAKKLRKILKVPGEHNISNALAALTLARILKISDKVSFKALSEYRGSWRRFEERKAGGLTIISDYGHHPTEIRVTLKAAREKYPKKKIWCVYQPHQHQRTYYLFKDFVKVFRQAPTDKIIITDIYDVAGREEKEIKKKINSEKLARAVRKESVTYLSKNKLSNFLKKEFPREGVLIIMGAGDIYKLVDSLG
ncbi:MAG: UDP-N-acetylmuramate--L-alanine ligase, partial [bacterium]|nr:UDP-N-acetylmuramate--L-alanine ligase [bacterium]